MTERPIIFNSEMVKAVLDGKTQTRRIIKIDSPTLEFDTCNPPWPTCADQYGDFYRVPCKYGKPGDKLWVKETFSYPQEGAYKMLKRKDKGTILYRIRYEATHSLCHGYKRFPSIHMPRWASRITLEIVNVRVERLNDISEEDAIAEGVDACEGGRYLKNESEVLSPSEHFAVIWDKISPKHPWKSNPWVWAIEFNRI